MKKSVFSISRGLICVTAVLFTISSYASVDLITIYNQAQKNDAQILQAKADRDAVFASIDYARSSLLPQINLSAGYNITRHSNKDLKDADVNTTNAGIQLSQQIFSPKSWINLDITEMAARIADAQYAAAQQDLVIRVAKAYFGVLKAMDNLTFAQAENKTVSRQLQQTKQRYDVGLSAITDVHDAQAEYDNGQASLILAQNALVNSYEDLTELTGKTYTSLYRLDTKRFKATQLKLAINELISNAEMHSFSLLAKRISKDSAKKQIDLASAGHLPTIALNAGYGYSKSDYLNTKAKNFDDNAATAGVTFSMPLFAGGGIHAQVKQAQYNYVSASEALDGEHRATVKNVRASYNNINASISALRAYSQVVVSAKSALTATEAGFEVGTRTIVDVLTANRSLYDANRQLSSARYDYILSVLQLRQLTGNLTERDVLTANHLLATTTTKK